MKPGVAGGSVRASRRPQSGRVGFVASGVGSQGGFSSQLAGGEHAVAQAEEDLDLVVALGQTPGARFPVPEQVLEEMEGVLHKRPPARRPWLLRPP